MSQQSIQDVKAVAEKYDAQVLDHEYPGQVRHHPLPVENVLQNEEQEEYEFDDFYSDHVQNQINTDC